MENKAKKDEVKPVEKKEGKTYVTSPFRDKANFEKAYEVDQDVSDLDEDRIKELSDKGLVETYKKPEKVDPPKA